MTRARTRLGAAAVGLGGAVFAIIQILEHSIGAFNPRPEVSALVAATVGVAGLTLQRARYRVGERSFLKSVLARWPLGTAVKANPFVLGVFPPRDSDARYIPRTIDARVDEALRRGGLVLLVGPDRSGKSRTAYEALRRTLPTSPLVVPAGGPALDQLLSDGSARFPADAVWWVDDLERFLPHIDARELSALLGGARTVVATIREEPWRALLRADGESGEQARQLVAATTPIRVDGNPDPEELRLAGELYPGVAVGAGIGEALAAGDDGSAWAPPRELEERARRQVDPVLMVGMGASVILVAALAILGVTDGFLTRTPPSIGAQVDAIRERAARDGRPAVQVFSAQFHGFEQPSTIVVLRPSKRGSDELRVYDQANGRLRRRVSFQPHTHGLRTRPTFRWDSPDVGPGVQRREGLADYQLEKPQVVDVDGDGENEMIADYTMPAVGGSIHIPVSVAWNDQARRYELSPLVGEEPPGFDPGFDPYSLGLYTLSDPKTHARLEAGAVFSFVVVPATGAGLLATARYAGRDRTAVLGVSVYRLSYSRGKPQKDLFCITSTGIVFVRPVSGDDNRPMLRRLAVAYVKKGSQTESEGCPTAD